MQVFSCAFIFPFMKIQFKSLPIITAFIVLIGSSACNREHKEKTTELRLQATTVYKTDTSLVRQYVCQIKAIQHIELRALEKGYLQEILVDEGELVKKGTPMFRIMPMLYKAELKKAEAEANYAEIEYQNTLSLAQKKVVSNNELALSKAKLERAKAELQMAQVHVDFTELRAPFDGIMDRLQVRLGSLIDEGDLLTTLSDNSKMWVYFNVPEAEYLNYSNTNSAQHQKVQLMMANNRIFPQTGIVETIEADFDNETGNIPFRATFENPKRLLRHGETGNILLHIPCKDALVIPQKATYEILDKKYVYVINKENKAETREISIAGELPDLFIVDKGLREGDKILIEGIRKVNNGEVVKYDMVNPREVMKNLSLHAE